MSFSGRNIWLILGGMFGFLAVLLGAVGAHALEERLAAAGRLGTYELSVRYHLAHALALILWGLWKELQPRASALPGAFFVLGILGFSGSLYGLSVFGWKGMVWVTPFGGMALLAGWLALLAEFFWRPLVKRRE